MGEFDRLELSTETLRELTREEMGQVAGGTVGAVTRTCYIINPGLVTAIVGAVTKQASVGCA